MAKSKEILRLERERKTLFERVNKINDQIHAERERTELPPLPKKYEGKFFKFKNGAGGENWFIYVLCHRVVGLGKFLISKFEIDKINGDNSFSIQEETWDEFLFETEIKPSEYFKALEQLKALVTLPLPADCTFS